jgi:formaldehyde-activating enzyme involved in methanogenesis
MSKIIKLTETDLSHLVKKILKEQKNERYMFFSNLQQIRRQMDILLDMNPQMIEDVLEDGHDWAQDHIATAKESIDQVFDFLMNKEKEDDVVIVDSEMSEGKKKSGTKLCARGKAAAKAKYDVYPSAYANGYAVQVCKGTKPGLDGKKRCSPPYC